MLGRKNSLVTPFKERELPHTDGVEIRGASRVSEIVGAAAAQAGNVKIMPVAPQQPEQSTDDLPPAS